jgi:uncharacterized protein (TIGR03437 family)
VVTGKGVSRDVVLRIEESAPGLFETVLNGDGSVNSADNPAAPGDWLLCFGTGLGLAWRELFVDACRSLRRRGLL